MKVVATDTIEAFAALYKGRTDSHGGVNECIYEPVTLTHYEKHLKGEANLGIYFLLDDNTTYFAAVDLDRKNFTQAKAIQDELAKSSIPAYIAASKSKGYHIYTFALDKFKAVEIRQVLKHVLSKLNIKAEVFPKQDYHQPDDADGTKHPGSYINIPSFGYTRPFLSGDLKEVPLEIALEKIKFVTQETIDRVLKALPKEKPLKPEEVVGRRKEHPPCLESISQGVDEQQRDAAALALARHYLIQAYEPGEVFWLLRDWDTQNRPPSYNEPLLEQMVRSAEKYRGLVCPLIKDKPTVSMFCVGDEKCDWPKPKKQGEPRAKERPEQSDEFNELAIGKLLESCPFIRHCQKNAITLSETWWWSMVSTLAVFGEPGRKRIHELSAPYPRYTERETDEKIKEALKAGEKDIGPHTCTFIDQELGFDCPADCLAKKERVKSPAGLAARLARLGNLPRIIVTNRFLKEKTTDTIAAVDQANQPPQLFERSGSIARIAHDEFGMPYIEVVTENACRGFIERAAAFVKVNNDGKELPAAAPPLDVVRDFMALPERNLPGLLNITEVPILRSDGSILTKQGYDKATRLYYEPAAVLAMPAVPNKPNEKDLHAAAAFIQEPLLDFPFDCKASKTNALAVLITPVCRPMIAGLVPLCLLDKPQPGTGAGLLTDVIASIATGRPAAMMAPPRSDEECEKRLASILLHGQSILIIDNVEGYLYFPSLAMLLTASTYQTRILGYTKTVRLPNRGTYIVTGNNIKLGGDMARRCYLSRMDAHEARPWQRDPKSFKYRNLIQWVNENRGGLLAAILTMARAWVTAGKPKPEGAPPLGGYEDWVHIIGGILAYAGFTDFLGNLEFMYQQADVETPQWEGFLAALQEVFGAEPTTVNTIVTSINDGNDILSGALPERIDRNAKKFNRSLASALRHRAGVRYPNGLLLNKCNFMVHHAIPWQVINYRESAEKEGVRGVSGKNRVSYKSATQGESGEWGSSLHEETDNNIEKKEDVKIQKEDKVRTENGLDSHSPDSPQSQKRGVSTKNIQEDHDLWAGMPDYPKEPCMACGGSDFWPDFKGKRFVCGRCHPQPQQIDMEV